MLGHLDLDECKQAVVAAARHKPFIAPAEIIAEIADRRSAAAPHSDACRRADCRDCKFGWCMCTCHPRAVTALAGPERPKPALPSSAPKAAPRGGEPRQLGMGDMPVRRT